MIHNVVNGVPCNVAIDGEKMRVKNTDLYKRVLEAERKGDAGSENTFKPINNQSFTNTIIELTETLETCTGNKRWILDCNVHTLKIVHYRLSDMKNELSFL